MTIETLEAALDDAFAHLERAADHRKSAMHTPVVSTADGDMRVMVLRSVDRGSRTLRFHTDARAPKVAVVNTDPAAGLLFYDPAAKLQLRCRGVARIERDGAAVDAAWNEATNFAKRCYLAPQAPSTAAPAPTSNIPPALEGVMPSDAEVAPGRSNFALLLIQLTSLDWFHLCHEGHRRAHFRWDEKGSIDASWLAP